MRIRILPADPDPEATFQFDAGPDPDLATKFSPDLYPPMLQNYPLKLPPFHCDADPDPSFHFELMRIRSLLFTLMRIRIQLST